MPLLTWLAPPTHRSTDVSGEAAHAGGRSVRSGRREGRRSPRLSGPRFAEPAIEDGLTSSRRSASWDAGGDPGPAPSAVVGAVESLRNGALAKQRRRLGVHRLLLVLGGAIPSNSVFEGCGVVLRTRLARCALAKAGVSRLNAGQGGQGCSSRSRSRRSARRLSSGPTVEWVQGRSQRPGARPHELPAGCAGGGVHACRHPLRTARHGQCGPG